MKVIITVVFLIVVVGMFYYLSNKKNQRTLDSPNNTETINIKNLRPNDIVHEELSNTQIQRIKVIQETLKEVNPTSLDKTIDNFKRDLNPNSEIDVWEVIAGAYQKININQHDLSINHKNEIYNLLLMRSMMPSQNVLEQIKLQTLNNDEAIEILNYYSKKHKLIVVEVD